MDGSWPTAKIARKTKTLVQALRPEGALASVQTFQLQSGRAGFIDRMAYRAVRRFGHNHVFATLQSLQPISAASQHLNFSRQAGLDLVSDLGRSAFSFPPEPRLDCRSWLTQTGISLASGALTLALFLVPLLPLPRLRENLSVRTERFQANARKLATYCLKSSSTNAISPTAPSRTLGQIIQV